jgi:putative ABC transport system permease protein
VRKVTLRGLRARKLRTALTALAIVLGVAMITGSSVLGATMQRAFEVVFSAAYESTDVVVSGKPVVEWSESGAPTLPQSLLTEIEAVPGVAAVAGAILDFSGNAPYAVIVDGNGETISGDPSFVIGFRPEDETFNPLRLPAGRWAAADEEVVLDASTAESAGLGVGDTVLISALTPQTPFEIVGLGRFGEVSSLGRATMAVFDLPVAQRLLQKEGRLDVVSAAAEDGVTPAELARRLQPFASGTVQVQTADERAEADREGVALFVDVITWILRGFGGVVLFVGAFVIVNTLSITVAQRTRELGTLRLIGATRGQVRRAVLLESLVIGALASALGVVAGIGLAVGLRALIAAFGIDFPRTGLVVESQTLLVAFVVGVGVTVLAGLLPAARATRISPVEAVREGAIRPRGKLARAGTVLGAVMLAGGAGLLALGLLRAGDLGVGGTLGASLGGMLLLLVGAALLVPLAVPVVARLVGAPAARLGGVPGRLARDNAIRNPGRTAATAAALMIGIALVTAVAVLGRSLKQTAVEATTSQIGSTHVLQSESAWETLPPGSAEALEGAPGVEALSAVRYDRGKVGAKEVDVSGIDPATIDGPYVFTWEQGSVESLSRLGEGGALVRSDLAEQQGLDVGDRISLLTAGGETASHIVQGVFDPPKLDSVLGHVVISQQAFDAAFPQPANAYTFLDLAPAPDVEELARRLDAYPGAVIRTTPEMVAKRQSDFDSVVALLTVLLALAVITGLLGMVNALALAVIERTREIGALRAVGMTRRQTRRMVRHEAVTTSLIGAAVGLPLGILVAWVVIKGLERFGAEFHLPVTPLVVYVVVVALAGVLAAVLPARRAARLDVLKALQYESGRGLPRPRLALGRARATQGSPRRTRPLLARRGEACLASPRFAVDPRRRSRLATPGAPRPGSARSRGRASRSSAPRAALAQRACGRTDPCDGRGASRPPRRAPRSQAACRSPTRRFLRGCHRCVSGAFRVSASWRSPRATRRSRSPRQRRRSPGALVA